MEFQQIKELIKLVNDTDLTDVEIKTDDLKITIKREKELIIQPQVMTQMAQPQNQVEVVQQDAVSGDNAPIIEDENVYIITSPIVGTFYASPSPEADCYVQKGDTVKAGDTLCIIEAMKLMNDIEADVAGEIIDILVDNEDPVEYGQPLFKIRI